MENLTEELKRKTEERVRLTELLDSMLETLREEQVTEEQSDEQ